jgi:hypothetical protein
LNNNQDENMPEESRHWERKLKVGVFCMTDKTAEHAMKNLQAHHAQRKH